MEFVIQHSYWIPLLPLIGAALAGFFGARWLKGQSHWPIWLGVGASAVLSLMFLFGMVRQSRQAEEGGIAGNLNQSKDWFTWIDVGNPHAEYHPATEAAALPSTQPSTQPAAMRPATPAGWYDDKSDPTSVTPTKLTALTSPFGRPLGPAPVHFTVTAGFWFDPLTAVMLTVVCGIGFFITVFSAGYMKGEEGYFRFFAYLGLFIFMMTCLVMGNNLVMLYLGWEGVGLCSYLLIGYYYEKPAAREAAKKAFLVNRIGDFGFGLGIMLCFLAFGTVSYFGQGAGTQTGLLELASNHQAALTAFQQQAMNWIPFLLMLGAFGKSAQFPLYVWLPDAMEGPTPVSALIHAATMVTAGVYMIARCGALFAGNQAALVTVAAVGAFTALFAATIALRQFDLKKVFAYSTISQLGYMFVGVGILAPTAAIFHLVTHAFFKALLFLSSGVVMHAMSGVLDMRQMSGLRKVLPKTNILMLIGCAALAGFPFVTSGFFSKDEIIGASLGGNVSRIILWIVLVITAFLTSYYTFRLYFRVFWGPLVMPEAPADGHGHGAAHSADHASASESAVQTGTAGESGVDEHLKTSAHKAATGDHGHHNHEPAIMILPLVVLAIGAVLAGYLNWPFGGLGQFLGKSHSFTLAKEVAVRTFPTGAQTVERGFTGETHWFEWSLIVGIVTSVGGIVAAWFLHLRNRAMADRLAHDLQPLTGLLEAKYWVDEIYQAFIVDPLRWLGNVFFAVDRYLIDVLISIVSWIPQAFGWILKFTVQRGSLQGYASAMLFGVVVILWIVFGH